MPTVSPETRYIQETSYRLSRLYLYTFGSMHIYLYGAIIKKQRPWILERARGGGSWERLDRSEGGLLCNYSIHIILCDDIMQLQNIKYLKNWNKS